ncbi:hypothetical protein GXB81_24085 [Paraburkholderia sp. Ac-20336]|uniref:hypothetical protein n=1 Tax=Burkholderiaceae TaxID=119060 RepID=UPI001423B80A|nr:MULTISPECIES: hypothetical protein [Burkholderiaceae]MBN3806111.1 hypothetical protein [Paraburkholderia sp. Ac-20336]NIF56210.1 hypothetical protein [Burkholderia sp. Ax-1724]
MNAGMADTRRSRFFRDVTRSNDDARAPLLARASGVVHPAPKARRAARLGASFIVALCALHIGDAAAQGGTMLDERVTQQSIGETICRAGYADAVAPPFDELMAHKDRMLAARGIDADDGVAFALDRRVPVVLGGSPDAPANLDLRPWAGPQGERRKARAAVMLKHCVCTGQLSLAQAQTAIVGNWSALYSGFGRASCDVSRLDVAAGDANDDAGENDSADRRGEAHERAP